jgi:glycosyltransferase involved in cell wall biosynthesis
MNTKLKTILFTSNVASPYINEYLEMMSDNFKITIVYERKQSKFRNKSWSLISSSRIKMRWLKGFNYGIENALSFGILKFLFTKFDYIIIGNFTSLTGILFIFFLRLFKIKFILFSEGGIHKTLKSFKEKLKRFVISKASLYLSSCKVGDEYFLYYGANASLIKRIPFTTLHIDSLKDVHYLKIRKGELRVKYNIPINQIVILAVGRFIPLKNFDILIRISKFLSFPYSIYLIGEGPELEKYNSIIKEQAVKNFQIISFLPYESLDEFYMLSDIFVLPTFSDSWGLVILEAMSRGLSVITTDRCVAGLELIENYENGFILPPNNENELINKINLLARSQILREKIMINNLSKIHYQTFENMVFITTKILNEFKL